jgi:flagellar hook protein FlgE
MSFQHGLSGLNAAARNLDVIGNNVANANTVGAKQSRAEFADLYANSLAGVAASATGLGVTVSNVAQQFTQGDIVSTQNPLDMAINGRGFFRTSLEGEVRYTRNGQFRMDSDGYVVNAQGARLTGFAVDASGQAGSGSPTDLRVDTGDLAPRPTTTVRGQLNLDARDPSLVVPFDAAAPSSYQGAMSVDVFDSLGRDHGVTLFFRKTAPNAWEVRATADGTEVAGFAQPLTFDTGGRLTAPAAPFDLTIPLGTDASGAPVGTAAPGSMTVRVDLAGATQFGSGFATTSVAQDGYAAGRLSGFAVEGDGVLVGRYSNGQTRPQGQVALANFVNPQGLVAIGDNAWVEGSGSGAPTLGAPGSGILGALQAGAVENANVDLTAELVSMITAQRIYQANAQTIKTHDQMLQTIVNLR